MIRTEKRIRLCAVLIAVNLAFIWGNSLLPGELSLAFSSWAKDALSELFSLGVQGTGGKGLIRKIAHFSEFAMLGMLLRWFWGMLGKGMLPALLCGFLAACTDEIIQCFVPERGPRLLDVGIDTCGVAAGILLLWLGYTVVNKRTKNNPLEE